MKLTNISWLSAKNMMKVGLCTRVTYLLRYTNIFYIRDNKVFAEHENASPQAREPAEPQIGFKIVS